MESLDPSENPDHAKLVAKMGLDNRQLRDAAEFCNNKYPNLELDFEVEDKDAITAGEPAYLKIKVSRVGDEDEDEDGDEEGEKDEPDTTVHAPFYPTKKLENWWLVVSDERAKNLLAIKRITVTKELRVRLQYLVPTSGKHDLSLLLISDSYLGVDQSIAFKVDVAEGMDEDDDEEEEEEDEEEEE